MSLLEHKARPLAGILWILTTAGIVLLVGLPARIRAAAPPSEKTKKNAPAAKATESERPAAADEDAGELPENPFPRRFKAPELDGGTGWLNASGEITMKDLRGKVVLLDFWTFCCINCMHVLPDLAYLEKKYDKQLVVIGVHSAKFSNEKETENIRRAIGRYEIAHPVINDSDMVVWRKFEEFGVRGWPSMVLID